MSAATQSELASKYDPAAVEAEVYADWLANDCFKADPAQGGEPYCIVIPPPNVTGALHLGHAINNTLQDILIRVHRMRGFNTVWIPGIDHAGIATQAVVEKQLKEKENKTRHDVGREGLVARIWEWKQQFGDRILEQLKRLGCSCDWSRTRFTLDEMCARAVRETFFKLFKDGLVYRGKRLVNWDVHLQTSISDDEIYHETVKTFLWHIKYPIVETPDEAPDVHPGLRRATHMTVATTRPETLLGDTAVAVHSQDPRWNWAIGMQVELPLTGRKIPIIADDILVDPKFGSGVVKVTPGHDPNDYAVYQRHLGKPDEIGIINLLNPDGTLNENTGKYAGMKREAARKKVVEDLGDLLAKEEPYESQVGHSDRSKTAVEPYLSDQWFVKMAPLAEPALQVVRDGTIKFFPERHAQQYLSWLGEKRDWPISRQLWWGHRITVFSANLLVPLSGTNADAALREIQSALDDAAAMTGAGAQYCVRLRETLIPGSAAANSAPKYGLPVHYDGAYICASNASAESALVQLFESQRNPNITVPSQLLSALPALMMHLIVSTGIQDPDVLDTWFSSALWPHSTLGWPERTADLARWYPTSVLLTGRDIITLWVARMVMMGMYNMAQRDTGLRPVPDASGVEKSASAEGSGNAHGPEARVTMKRLGVPFAHVAINPTILDGKGERMSKSKGNGVDPVDIIETHGADALRFTLTTMATETQDVRLPVKKDANGRNSSEKFDLGRNFCTKLWNAARFVLANVEQHTAGVGSATLASTGNADRVAEATPPVRALVDRWVVSRFNRAVEDSNAALTAYRFDQYAKACYDFFWRDFCDWYVEAAKPALKDAARSAGTAAVLSSMLDGALRLMHPVIPFITERLWWRLHPGTKLISAPWPEAGGVDSIAEEAFGKLQELIVAIRNVRNEYNIKKPVPVSLAASGELAKLITNNRELIETLAVCSVNRVEADLAAPVNAARANAAGADLFVEGVIDPDAEKMRLSKHKETLNQKIAVLKGRLASPAYVDKAPAHLVQQTRDELAALEAELKKLEG